MADNAVMATVHPAQRFPQQRVTNLGRRVSVDVAAEPERFVFAHRGVVVAELHHPTSTGTADGSLLGWRLTFPESGDRMLAAPENEPPIGPALLFVDVALRDSL
jgi:hypothetical protein